MQKRILILGICILSLISGKIFAQDAHFSQFYANPIYLNPAFAGTNICPRISLSFRDQWPSNPSTFISYSASYDQHFDKIAGGIGVIFFGDRAGQGGIINTHSISAMYSVRVKVSQAFQMRFAIQGSYQNKSLAWDKLIFSDMIHERYGYVYETNEIQPDNLNTHVFDLSAGFIGYTEYLYFGLAVHHITRPYDGYTPDARLPVKWTGHVGATIDLKRKSKKEKSLGDISLSPNIIYQHQSTFHYLNTGLYMNVHPFTVGVWFRNSFTKKDAAEALVFMCGFQQDFLRIAYSYDVTLGKLAGNTGGSHEVSLQFLLRCPEKTKKIKELDCPSF